MLDTPLLVLACAPLFQGSPVLLDPETVKLTPASWMTDSSQVDRILFGDVDGDQRADEVALVDGKVVVHRAPNVFSATEGLAHAPHGRDIAIVPGENGTDSIAIATADGLELWSHGAGSFTGVTLLGPDVPIEGISAVDLGLSITLAALTPDGSEIHFVSAGGGLGNGFPASVTMPVQDALQVLAVDWIPGGPEELAVRYADGVQILDVARMRLIEDRTGAYHDADAVLARSRPGGENSDRLVLVHDDGRAGQTLRLLWHGQLTWPQTRLGPLGVGAIAAGDLNEDGVPELFLASEHTPNLLRLYGPASNRDAYALSASSPLGASAATGSGGTNCAVVDLDGDGDLDVVHQNSAADTLHLFENRRLYVEHQTLSMLDYAASEAISACPSVTVTYGPPHEALTSGQETLEVLVFHVGPSGQASGVATPLHHVFLDGSEDDSANWVQGFDLSLSGCEPDSEYYFVARLLGPDGASPDMVLMHSKPQAYKPAVPDPNVGRQNGANPRTRVPFGPLPD